MMQIIVVILALVTVAPAAVKRDEYGGSNGSSSSSSSSQPVYSPSSSSPGSYNNGGPNSYNLNGYSSRDSYQQGSNQYSGDQNTAASSSSASYQAQPASQGNLYYYYYPVQDKQKDSSYHASSSNQYSNSVSPNFGTSGSGNSQISADSAQHSSLEPAASGQDLSYSAQDLSYSAQNIAQDYGSQNSPSYDQQLTSLANQLQQYGFGSGSGANAFNPSTFGSTSQGSYAPNSYDASNTAYGAASSPSATYGVQPEGSGHFPSGSHPSYSAAAAAASYGAQNGAQYNPQSNGYGPYNGQHGYGNYASASGPQATYEPPSSGYRRYGLSSILMPMLALAGLSLLIPTVTSLGSSGRRKRSIEDNAKESAMTGYIDRLERYYSIYRTAVEKEECMNRILCELGDAVSGVRGKSTVLTVLEKVVPTWMGNKMGVFKNAALSGEYGKCKKYTC
jgi:hypothetical protein